MAEDAEEAWRMKSVPEESWVAARAGRGGKEMERVEVVAVGRERWGPRVSRATVWPWSRRSMTRW